MAAGGDKTEKPTQSKLRKAREKGDIPRSKELSMAVGLVVSLITVTHFMPYYLKLANESFKSLVSYSAMLDAEEAIGELLLTNCFILIKFIITLIPIPLSCIVSSIIPGGWSFTPIKLKPDFKKINPASGIKRIFSGSHYLDVGKMILKCSIILFALYVIIKGSMPDLLFLQKLYLPQAILQGFTVFYDSFFYFIIIIMMFSLIDIPFSKFMFLKKMRMSKQEIKEEHKNNDGNPQIKGRIRQLQRQMAMGRISRAVPQADVIITNPTHYAVALKYDPQKAQAPYIVAKGIDDIALYIRQVAKVHHVEVIEFPPLARAVYYTTKVNQQIPAQLFKAIAHVLTYVMQLRSWRAGKIEMKPRLNRQITIPKEVLKADGEQ